MPTTPAKRQKEKNRQDKQKEKDSRRDQRKRENANKGPRIAGHDPDIDGIVPGPQPLPEEFLY